LRALVKVLERVDVTPGSLRAQAEVKLGAEVQAPTMEEVANDENPSGP